MKLAKYFYAFCTLGILAIAYPTLAADFNPNNLISNSEISDYNSMSLKDIQDFLSNTSGTLKNYSCPDKDGNIKTAPQTFYEVAQQWSINPKYLMVLVEKEMGLLNDPTPKTSQYDWATGYGCPDGGGCNDKYKGFYKQVNSAAAQTRYYLDNINQFNYRPGNTYVIDGQPVTPENAATAGLYNYTPHVDCYGKCGGNKSFWILYSEYFSKKWPDGSLLQGNASDTVYLIKDGEKKPITSKSVLYSIYSPDKIINVDDSDLSYYDLGTPIKYLNFSLLQTPDKDIYMVVGDQKRLIQSADVFKKLGFKDDDITQVTDGDLASYDDGPNVTSDTIYPTGILLQDTKTKAVYYVISGQKKLIQNQEILNFNFKGMPIKKTTTMDLDQYMPGAPVLLPDGGLVKIKGSSTVYVISNGKRMAITNGNVFTSMKYKWKNVLTISKDTLNLIPVGDPIAGSW